MITKIFSDEEHQILESYITEGKVDKEKLEKILNEITTQKNLFDDIFLYLQVKKTLGI